MWTHIRKLQLLECLPQPLLLPPSLHPPPHLPSFPLSWLSQELAAWEELLTEYQGTFKEDPWSFLYLLLVPHLTPPHFVPDVLGKV